MPTASPIVLPLPPPEVALVDPQTGLPTAAYFDWLKRMEIVLRQVRSEIP